MVDIKLKDLRYLAAVADTRHFGRAAERCFVSQPTLSAQLKKLEDSLGVQLIERQPKRVALTHRDPLAGRLRLALLPTIGPYLLPQVAPLVRRALPRLELLLYEYQTQPMLQKLHAGELDAGILALPVELDGLEVRELYQEAFQVAVPAQHRLAKRASVRLEDLHDEPLLLLEEGHCLRDQALSLCGRVGATEKQDFRATSLETLRQMVATGAGVTLLPELASRGVHRHARGVAVRPLAKPAPVRRIGAVWRKSSARGAAIEAICQLITAHAK